jgi:hypothetical protein
LEMETLSHTGLEEEESFHYSFAAHFSPRATPSPPSKRRRANEFQALEGELSAHPVVEGAVCRWLECKAVFSSLKELGLHIREHLKHQKAINRKAKTCGYVCKWEGCSRQTPFKGCYNLEHHLRYQHTGEKPFECDTCSSCFAQRSDLLEHRQKIHSIFPTPHKRSSSQPAHGSFTYLPGLNHLDPVGKVHQIMAPRTRPVPILPSPSLTEYAFVNVPARQNHSLHVSTRFLRSGLNEPAQLVLVSGTEASGESMYTHALRSSAEGDYFEANPLSLLRFQQEIPPEGLEWTLFSPAAEGAEWPAQTNK